MVNSTILFNEGSLNLTVTAGVSNTNLWDTNLTSWIDADVFQDLTPIHGGLGVHNWRPGPGSGTESFEGSLFGNGLGDEILFFDFGETVSLNTILFNGNHTETVTDGASFRLFTSLDGLSYNPVSGPQYVFSNTESLSIGISGQYFALGAAGVGRSYVEKLDVTRDPVPEPATMLLFGTGLAGLAMFNRRKKN